jgi:hypothetical protein
MKTAMAHFTDETTLLIQGIKSKFDEHGNLIDIKTKTSSKFYRFVHEACNENNLVNIS